MQLKTIHHVLLGPYVRCEFLEDVADELIKDDGAQAQLAARLDPYTLTMVTAALGMTAIRCVEAVDAAQPYVSLLAVLLSCAFFEGTASAQCSFLFICKSGCLCLHGRHKSAK